MHPLDVALNYCLHGEFDKCKDILDTLDQNDIRVKYNLGWHYLRKGHLKKGFEYMNHGRWINVFGAPPLHTKAPIYHNENLNGKTLLLQSEGGLGDEIINVRFAEVFAKRGAKVVVGCTDSLYCLFNKIPYISALVERQHSAFTYHDYWVPAMSAPSVLDYEYKDLKGTPYLQYFNKRKLPGKFKIGIRWSGNPQFEAQQHRVFPVQPLIDLHKIEKITLYSLQRDDDLKDNLPFADLRYDMKTWQDTAEIINGLDLVITSCTSIAHLSAALGKPTWIIVPILPYYTWALPGKKSPWHDTVTIYRQTKHGNWDEPFTSLKNDLIKLVSTV